MAKKKDEIGSTTTWLIAIAAVFILFNQIQLFQLNSMLGVSALPVQTFSSNVKLLSNGDLSTVDVEEIQSTAQAVAAVYDFSEAKDSQDVIDLMIPQGTPDYGEEMGITYDDPVSALDFMARELYPRTNQEIQKNEEQWERYKNLASKPRGISCEYCCGVGPIGATPDGKSRCGCQHNPAILALTQYLIMSTEYTDAEILREAMRWKSLWFPRNMVEIGLKITGGDTSVLADAPGMVGGC